MAFSFLQELRPKPRVGPQLSDFTPIPNDGSSIKIVIVGSGDALHGNWQSTVGIKVAEEMEARGLKPPAVIAGSSSGSLVALTIADGRSQKQSHQLWVSFARKANKPWNLLKILDPRVLIGRPMHHTRVLNEVLDEAGIDFDAICSRKDLTYMSAATVVPSVGDVARGVCKIVMLGISYCGQFMKSLVVADPTEPMLRSLDLLQEMTDVGHNLFKAEIATTKPVNGLVDDLTSVKLVRNGAEMRSRIMASCHVPFLFGMGMKDGDQTLIDAAWSENCLVEHCVKQGATDVFVIVEQPEGGIIQRAVQRQLFVENIEPIFLAGAWLTSKCAKVPVLNRVNTLFQTGADHFTSVATPTKIEVYQKKYPGVRFHVIHPGESSPRFNVINRFFASSEALLTRYHESGVEQAQTIAAHVFQNYPVQS